MLSKDSLENRVQKKRRRLQKLLEKEAVLGINTPPEILIEIEDLEAEIIKLQVQLTYTPEKIPYQKSNPGQVSYSPTEIKQNSIDSVQISPTSPLLMGILIDVSSTMSDTLLNQLSSSRLSFEQLRKAINKLVTAAISYCRSPYNDEVLPSFALFIYGYGFGTVSRTIDNFRQRVGILTPKRPVSFSGPVRDLFVDTSSAENLPLTPRASELETFWPYYKRGVESQLTDAIFGDFPILYEGLCAVRDRFVKELEKPYYENPILLLVSSGYLDKASDSDLNNVIREIQQLGVQIMSCYIGERTITQPKQFYAVEQLQWPQEAKRLFDCSSVVSTDNHISDSITEFAREKGWSIPESARLFIQANHYDMLEEFIEIILTPLKP